MRAKASRVTVSAFLLVTVLSTALYPVVAQAPATPSTLSLRVYRDGVVHVTYALTVNQSHPHVTVALFGSVYANVFVVDENLTFLDFTLDASTIQIDTLGAATATIDVDVLDLTNKTQGVWTLQLNATIPFTTTFPRNTTIVDLSAAPIEITTEDQQTILTMPAGLQSISYLVGAFTPQEEVRQVLDAIAQLIAQLKANGVNVAEAEAALQQAEAAYAQGNYEAAEQLATEVLRLLADLEAGAGEFPYHIAALVLAATATLGVILLRRRGTPRVDADQLLRVYPWLREDQKDVVRYLATRRDGVFEAELRARFGVPKSSMWRLIKKLEEEGILTVRQLRQQNFIELKAQ
jgi:uncharacterized membrane protein